MDKEPLLPFALTCQLWHLACRSLIFRRVFLKGHGANEDPLASLVEILDSDSSIGPLVWCLKIEVSPPTRWSCDQWVYDFPRMLNTRLPSLRTIDIHGLGNFTEYRCHGFFSHLSLFSTVKSFKISHCCILYHALNLFVSSLTNLEHLHIHDFWLDSQSETEPFDLSTIPQCPKLPTSLKSFRFHSEDGTGPSAHAFATWISPVRTLRSCGIHIYREQCLVAVGELLRTLGDSLEHLELRFLDFLGWSQERGTASRSSFLPSVHPQLTPFSRHFTSR